MDPAERKAVVFMKIDLSCPVEVWNASLPTPEHPACDLQLYNLCGKKIVSVELNVRLMDRFDTELTHILHRCYSLNGIPFSVFPAVVTPEEDKVIPFADLHHTEVSVEKVWFDDNVVWRRDKAPLTEYTSNALESGRGLEMLRYVAGSSAVGFPEEQEKVWLCVCGRPNPQGAVICSRCRQTKEQVFASYNRQAVQDIFTRKEHQLDLRTRAVREDTTRLQKIREEDYNRVKARSTGARRMLIALAATLAAVLVLTFGVIPGIRYLSAVYGMEHNDAAGAEKTLEAILPFPGAEAKLKECRVLRARQSLDSESTEALAEAAAILRTESKDEADPELAKEADYRRAGLLLTSGDIAGAEALYTTLGEYKDSAAMLPECTYLQGEDYYNRALYPLAYSCYSALGDYKDAAEKASLCVYLPAADMMENGEYAAAITEFNRIPDYSDSRDQIRICRYLQARGFEAAGDRTAAADAYADAVPYADAQVKAGELYFALATEAEATGDYGSAAALYFKAEPMEGAREKALECTYTQGVTALSQQDYEGARELFASLPADYSDAALRVLETWYRPGVTALKGKKWAEAVNLLTAALGYKDASAQLEKARYGLAGSLQKKEDYAGAIEQYELLGSYSDSEKQLVACRYAYGLELLKKEEFTAAGAQFALLDNYKDSATRLKEARYGEASGLLNAGDPVAARTIFESLGNYKDAPTRVKACDYARAVTLLENGDAEPAAILFSAAGNYSDAAAKASELYAGLALQAEETGRHLTAAGYYVSAGNYPGAAEKAEALYDGYYGEVSEAVKQAMAEGNYSTAILLMDNIVMTDLPAKYAGLTGSYHEACYRLGSSLLSDGKPYEALPYLRKDGNIRDTASLLKKGCYILLGSWKDNNGNTVALFRENGTCVLDGHSFFFNVNGYDVFIGETPDALAKAYRMSNVSSNALTLTDSGNGRVRRLSRTAETEMLPEEASQPEELPEESFVVEDEAP